MRVNLFSTNDEGMISFNGREALGITAVLCPNLADTHGDMLYTLWIVGEKGRVFYATGDGKPKTFYEEEGMAAAKRIAFDPVLAAKVQGIEHCFETCPRCKFAQKCTVDANAETLTCHFCDCTWNYQGAIL